MVTISIIGRQKGVTEAKHEIECLCFANVSYSRNLRLKIHSYRHTELELPPFLNLLFPRLLGFHPHFTFTNDEIFQGKCTSLALGSCFFISSSLASPHLGNRLSSCDDIPENAHSHSRDIGPSYSYLLTLFKALRGAWSSCFKIPELGPILLWIAHFIPIVTPRSSFV